MSKNEALLIAYSPDWEEDLLKWRFIMPNFEWFEDDV